MAVTAPESMGMDTTSTRDESLILFQPHLLSRIPRGWERAPTNAFTARLKGHKVWKRYNLRSDRATNTGAAPASGISGPTDAPGGTGRAVKRLRVDEELVPALERPESDGGCFVGTLWGSNTEDKNRKIASRRSAGHDELSKVSPLGEAVSKYDGGPHAAEGNIPEGSPVSHGARMVRNSRRATIAERLELLRTPCKGSVSPRYRKHPKSEASKIKRRMSFSAFAQNPVQVSCTTETAGEEPATGMGSGEEVQNCPTEEAATSETQVINTRVTLDSEQVLASGSGSVTKIRGYDVSSPLANVLSNALDIPMPEVHASSSVTGPCAEARPGSRLSDDTNMLKDFLDRVNAKKAALSADMTETVRPVSPSPPKSPRKVLAPVDVNGPSPKRSQGIANRPGTPPGKHLLGSSDLDELDDGAVECTSFRRSTRVRLPAPPKLARGLPSLIPVRRPNGPEPVVLQKSIAQELTFITRANTRRNKGRSKPADLTLQALAKEPAQSCAPKAVREGAKQVVWDERLVYHLEGKAEAEETRKPKMRRIQGLGTANGTPAAKKEDASAIAFPYPPRSSGHTRKVRTKA